MSQDGKTREIDEMTGLLTMPAFFKRTLELIRKPFPSGKRPAMVFFDIENFKSFNQRYGFEDGDDFLRTVASILTREFPDSPVAHFSGDRFGVCAPAAGVIDHIVHAHERVHAYQREVTLELKAGIYITTPDDRDVSVCCDRAKLASASAKGHFDQIWVLYDQEFDKKVQREQYVITNLDRAIDNGWIEAFYQPVMRVSTGELCGMEALARWKDPERGYLAPIEFVGTLERLHLISRLDSCMVRLVCQRLRQELDAGRPVVPVSFNLSRLDFELTDIKGTIESEVARADIPRELLNVEITESALTGDKNLLHNELRELHKLGYNLWMDDFGSGYSSLNSFKDLGLDFDLIKFDMDFLRDFEDHPQTKVILSAVTQMAKQLGTQTLAEGVEREDQLDFLRALGCDKAQGYLFGKPMPYEDLARHAEEEGWTLENQVSRVYRDRVLTVDTAIRPTWAIPAAASDIEVAPTSLWDACSSLCPQGLFWKDRQRRFIGVNQAFLDYYGLVSIREVIGRTDEDMGWHIDANPYRDDEERVLEEGVETRRVPGLCIRHGEVRNIVASKVPVLRDDEIVGLLGFFEDVTDELRQRLDPESEGRSLTGGALDMRNFQMVLENYEAAYRLRGKDFIYIDVRVLDAGGYEMLYGAGHAARVSARVVEAVRDLLGNRGVVHHKSGGSLAVVKQVADDGHAQQLVQAMKDAVSELRGPAGTPGAVGIDCGMARYSEFGDLGLMTNAAERRLDGR